ncbi:AfsR/SARP family transcriptional regulator [Phytohabitans houttuyneae]|uniref:SARP family transcriptional regulator n=1 Tax=Phytohabitans houttuyneae TaxID=1076126 RepID=A0A6V8K794_9ACTN|nr:BTAD domain-containing putative transcriptional regulator [Phytohabitans houttuyneae]GFJ79390.1 SARP family transcriptional regulator [Phytohabitans houttuyneae]
MSRGDVRFEVLGPWEVTDASGPVVIPAGRMRLLLASLLVSVGRSVPTDVLAEQVWPERMPARVRATVHTYIARLRRLLGHDVIETAPGGYRLAVAAERIDVWRFRELLRRAAAAETAERELDLLREALALWRGRPFMSMESTWLDREVVPRLGDEWFSATERRIDLEMRMHSPGGLVAELRDLVRSYPTRESLWLRLIEALHRCGRRAEALDAYQEVRGVLTDELGIEPSDALQQTHRRVLLDGSAPALAEPAADSVATRQLPHDIANFSSRAELAQLHRLMSTIARNERRVTHIVAIDGAPGIGKTTLAVHWAHKVADAYPDLQLHLNLRGYGPGEPMTPAAAAETLLRGLGVRADMIPPGGDERAALLRSTLAGRRVLLLLDNARDAEQVRPLLPGADSLVVVTSRNQLRGLSIRDGAHRVTLGPLPPHEALALLGAAFGRARMAVERDAAERLVEFCDGLPLALAIVAERAQRAGGLTEVVQALMDERNRLDVFGDGEGDPHTDLWVALSWSYRALTPDAAAMFRRLGLHPAGDFTADAAAALAGVPQRAAEQALDQLVAVHLLQQRRPRRYELHDLVRWYANEQARRDEVPGARLDAARRLVDWYLHAAVAADSALLPHRRRDYLTPYEPQVEPPAFDGAAAAVAWFEREYDNLRAVIRWADANGFGGHAWRTLTSMTTFFERRIPWQDAIEFHEWVLGAASAAGERTGEGYVLNGLGYMCLLKGDLDTAIRHFRGALDRFRSSGHVRGEAMLWGNLSTIYGERGDHLTARRYASRALEMCESLGYERGRALNLDNLGVALYAAGRYDAAIECHLEAGEINTKLGEANSEAINRHHLGRAYAALGRPRLALRAFREAIAMYRRQGNRRFEALVVVDVGGTLHQAGHGGLARHFWEAALVTLKEYDDPRVLEVRMAIKALHTAVA